ncbi:MULTISPECIES: hypothetical protein [Bacillus]|uniref:Uncharacterized protein n=2 Tax=Bacillus TaxID=1386 RepID=A0A0M3R9R9_9BACI|nr:MULTISPECIES: hypothetical protein [Bacillus]ALC81912.1 hypothetical protein AM592_10065 [Bacillus gobiensis]MBP1083230.1 hypothetical protein [Bacillus capparidis]MED1097671.1 hypothetical protein [Bacillus capparidis]
MEIFKVEGEWYVWILGVALLLIVLFMPKKNLTWTGIFVTLGVAGDITWLADTVAAVPIDLFDIAKKNTTELSDTFLLTFVPASIATIYVNFYIPQKKWVFTVFFTFLSFLLESGLVQVGYMKNIYWETWYGIPIYFVLFGFFFPWLLRILSKKLVKLDFSKEQNN